MPLFINAVYIQAIIEEHGHEIVWLPPYSPDLNSI
ncbi:transposase, partial [Suttonella ornithocola]